MSYIRRLSNIVTNKSFLVLIIFMLVVAFWISKRVFDSYELQLLYDENLFKKMIEDVEFSKRSIFVAIYMFKSDGEGDASELRNSLIRAIDRGVKVYIVMDVAKDDITSEANIFTGEFIAKHGGIVRYDSPLRKLHSKLMVIDDEIVYIGSHNYTNSAFSKNNETSVRIVSKKLAKEAINYIKSIKTYDR